ncbi:MAG: Uncharacterised protein [Bacteroidota bacterium]|nr:MAG: Uncharacterised protein [Bacteroidota bacterium]
MIKDIRISEDDSDSYTTDYRYDYNADNYPRNVQIYRDGEL